jgi:hypothetical protein
MEYLEVLLVVVVALAGLVVLALVTASRPATHLPHRHGVTDRIPEPPVGFMSSTSATLRPPDSRAVTLEAGK